MATLTVSPEIVQARARSRWLLPVAIPALALWLLGWIALSWGAVQDDALIHLRYADYLHTRHFITYDGVNPSYGTSSLLYVGLLAALRGLAAGPMLPRAVSSAVHLLLFALVATQAWRVNAGSSPRLRLLLAALLMLLAAPSAVRWLDDGMETGLALLAVGFAAWWTQRVSQRRIPSAADIVVSIALGAALVLLRTELLILPFFSFAIVGLADAAQGRDPLRRRWYLLAGPALAVLGIRLRMGAFLPDTALAKSHGIAGFGGSLSSAVTVLGGGLLFSAGMMLLWLLSAWMVLSGTPTRKLPAIAANALFPVVLLASALRGQEIQGARYLVWCFLFSICWNVLELSRTEVSARRSTGLPVAIFLLLCLAFLPFESRLMHRVLATRVQTMAEFRGQTLAPVLGGQLGVASDVGYIGYFSQARICDLAGLVNGRAAARLTQQQRLQACAALHPSFALVNAGQAAALASVLDLTDWRVCAQYSLGTLSDPDRHLLIVEAALAAPVCRATGEPPRPVDDAFHPATYR